jgi:rhamnosyltransferase
VTPLPRASVVIRTFDSAGTVVAAVESVRRQTVGAQVVVVDSGSTDGTLDLVAPLVDDVVHLPREQFTPGRSLNAGVAAARAEVVFALSSHAVLPRADWIERALVHHQDASTVAVCGAVVDPAGQPLTAVVRQDLAAARAHPAWGLTNTASSWRGDLVREHHFDEDLDACEDKEWAFRVLAAGGVVVVDPALAVDSSHRKREGARRYFRRVRREQRALLVMGALPHRTSAEVLGAWWRSSRSAAPGGRGLTSVTRLTDHLAELVAQREVLRSAERPGLVPGVHP